MAHALVQGAAAPPPSPAQLAEGFVFDPHKDYVVAKQRENHPHVVLRDTQFKKGGIVNQAPNGMVMEVLQRDPWRENIRVRSTTDPSICGWAQDYNLLPFTPPQPAKGKGKGKTLAILALSAALQGCGSANGTTDELDEFDRTDVFFVLAGIGAVTCLC